MQKADFGFDSQGSKKLLGLVEWSEYKEKLTNFDVRIAQFEGRFSKQLEEN